MTEQEFVDILVESHICVKEKAARRDYSKRLKKNDIKLSDYEIFIRWRSGGVSGGSCWNESNTTYYPVDPEMEPEFDDLNNLLEKVCPNITFLQYKLLCSNLIKFDTYTEGEYYGNSTTYAIKYINLKELFDKLSSLKLI